MKLPYDFATKNCKHLVYDLYKQCLKPGYEEKFEHFCSSAESVYREA